MPRVALISLYDEFCMGLRHVAGYLHRQGHDVTLINFQRYARVTVGPEEAGKLSAQHLITVTPFGEEALNFAVPYSDADIGLLLGLLRDRRAEVVGFSVPTYQKQTALTLSNLIKERLGLPVVWGGVHPTIMPEDCLADSDGVIDALCVGEGEVTFDEYLRARERGADPAATPIPGLWLRANGALVRNEPQFVQDLDRLGPPLHDPEREFMIHQSRIIHKEPLEDSEIGVAYKVMTGRGCPFTCSYCIFSTINRRFPALRRIRRRSPRAVIEELKTAKRLRPHLLLVEFYDDILTLRSERAWLEEFARMYKEEIGVPFWCYTHPLKTDREIFEILKDMGIQFILMGIQSGSDRLNFEVYDRRTKKEQILAAARAIAAAGIRGVYDVLCNNPYETEADLYETLDVLTQIPGERIFEFGKLAFFPATAITERAERDGLIGVVDEKLHHFYNALYLLAQYRATDRETILSLTQNPILRENPKLLWDFVRQAGLAARENQARGEAEQRAAIYARQAGAFQAELARVLSRRSVRYAVGIVEALKRIKRGLLGSH